jgi:16S rRNA (cytidine1402-2'-O)-methyltransferase
MHLDGEGTVGKLYLVATPIGNLEDMTFRAIRVLREVAVIAAEDTRTARKLLTHFDIHKPLISLHEYSDAARVQQILGRLETEDVALISEAGTPAISDPGYELVSEAILHQIDIVPIPGACALVTALAASGLPTDRFVFLGFLPNRSRARRQAIQMVATDDRTLIVYEAPHRLLDTLQDMLGIWGDRRIAIARELTKLHEEIWRGPLSDAIDHFDAQGVRGEFTLVIAGAPAGGAMTPWPEEEVRSAVEDCRQRGLDRSSAAKEVATQSGWARRDVYRLALGGPDERA